MLQKLFSSILMRTKFLNRKSSAISLKMINFCKNASCPASQDLLAFQNGETPPNKILPIRNHLSECEFCAAEVEFYAHFPQAEEEECIEREIPAALFELAEAILSNKQKNFLQLNQLLGETDKLKV
jgi:hypothetical protein